MELQTIIIIVVIALGIYIWYAIRRHEKKKINEALDKVKDFNPTETYVSRSIKTSISIDKAKNKICFIDQNRKTHPFSYKDIYESEILTDGNTYTKQSTGRTIGGLVIGGAVAGIAGAVVGGLSGKRKKVVNINKIDLKVTVNSTSKPVYVVNFFNPQLKKGGTITDKEAMRDAQHWHSLISVLIKRADKEEGIKEVESKSLENNKSISIPDELIKLNELKEKGILTQEEFENQKQKLLS